MGEWVTKGTEEMVVKSEWRKNLKHVASDIMMELIIRNSELSFVDVDGVLD